MSWQTVSPDQPCVLCGETKSDSQCRWRQEDDLILCATGVDGTLDGDRGLSYWGNSDDGRVGKYSPTPKKSKSNRIDINTYRDENGRLPAPNPKPKPKPAKEKRSESPLTRIERDRFYRKLLAQFPLTDAHRQKLKSKGIQDLSRYGSIPRCKQGGIKTEGIDPRLPGILPDGTLNYWDTRGGAIAILSVDTDGMAIGLQYRLDTAENGRYRNATSKNKKNPHGYPVHIGGEIPPTYFEGTGNKVLLAEGTGYKAQSASKRTGAHVIGIAGGLVTSTPKLIGEYLAAVAAKEGCEVSQLRPILVPDGGDRKNPSVMRRNKRTLETLRELGYEQPEVLWWRQNDRGEDIDDVECDRIQKAELLSLERFVAEFELRQWIESCVKLSEEDKEQFLKEFTPEEAIEFNSRFVPSERLALDGKVVMVQSGTGSGKSTAMIEAILRGQAATAIIEAILRNQASNRGAIIVSYRNSLLLQLRDKLRESGIDAFHLQNDLKTGSAREEVEQCKFELRRPDSVVLLCPDSLIHLHPRDFEGKDIFIDEPEGVADHFANSTTSIGRYRPKAHDILRRGVELARSLTTLDGTMTRSGIKFIESLAGDKPVEIHRNTQSPQRPKVRLFLGEVSLDEFLKNDKKYHWPTEDRSIRREIVTNPGNVIVFSDSQNGLEALEGEIRDRQPDASILRVDSTTAGTARVRDFLKRPDLAIERNGYSHILISPTAEAGFDLDCPGYFNDSYVLGAGVLRSQKLAQILARLRDARVPITASISPRLLETGNAADTRTAQETFKDFLDLYREEMDRTFADDPSGAAREFAKWIGSGGMGAIQQYRIDQTKHQTLEAENLRAAFKALLEFTGYEVNLFIEWRDNFDSENGELLAKAQEIKSSIKKRKKEAKEKPAIAIAEAPQRTKEEVEVMLQAHQDEVKAARRDGREPKELSPEEIAIVNRQRLNERYPGIGEKRAHSPDNFDPSKGIEGVRDAIANPTPAGDPDENGAAPLDDPELVKKLTTDKHYHPTVERSISYQFPELIRLCQQVKVYKKAQGMNRRKELFEESIANGYTPNPLAPKYDISQDFFDPQRFRYSLQAREAFIKLQLDKLTTGEEYTGQSEIIQNALAKLRISPKMADLLGVRFKRRRSGDIRTINAVLERFGFKVSKTNRDKEGAIYRVSCLKLSPAELPVYRAKIFALLDSIAAIGVSFTDKLISELGIGVELSPEGEVSKYTYGGRAIEIGVLPPIPLPQDETSVSTLKVQKLTSFGSKNDAKIPPPLKSTETLSSKSFSDVDRTFSPQQENVRSTPPQNLHESTNHPTSKNYLKIHRQGIDIGEKSQIESPPADPLLEKGVGSEPQLQSNPIPQWRGLMGQLVERMPEMPYLPGWLQQRWEDLRGMTLVVDGEPWLQNCETNDWQVYVNTYRGDKRVGCVSIPVNWFELLPAEVAS